MGLARPLRRRSLMLQEGSKGWRREAGPLSRAPQQSPSPVVDGQGSVNQQGGWKGGSLPARCCPKVPGGRVMADMTVAGANPPHRPFQTHLR